MDVVEAKEMRRCEAVEAVEAVEASSLKSPPVESGALCAPLCLDVVGAALRCTIYRWLTNSGGATDTRAVIE